MIIILVFGVRIHNRDLQQLMRLYNYINMTNPRTLIVNTITDIDSCTKPLPLSELVPK
jgi:hypothetical protein